MLLVSFAFAATPPSLAIPLYIYPDASWAQAEAGSPAFLVANPASGPGASVDTNYVSAIDAARAMGIDVIGYVDTAYGTRSATDVEADIDLWYAMYDVSGIFLDQTPGTADCDAFYSTYGDYADYTRTLDPSAMLVLNPGTDTCESYLDFADVLLIFEGTYTDLKPSSVPAWITAHDPSRFWLLSYGTPAAKLGTVLGIAMRRGVGHVYVTNDTLPNPWDTLPPYWTAEVLRTSP